MCFYSVRSSLHPDFGMTSGWARVTASLVYQSADLFTRRTWALMTFVRFPLAVMTDRWDFAGFVTRWWLDPFSGTARHCYLAAAASTLNDIRSSAWIARTAVTRRGAFVLTAVKRIFAYFLAGIRRVLRYAVAAFFIA